MIEIKDIYKKGIELSPIYRLSCPNKAQKNCLSDCNFCPGKSEYIFIDCSYELIDYDTLKTFYTNSFKKSNEMAKSADALLLSDDTAIFIEFKKSKCDSINSKLKVKIKDSLLIFTDIADVDINYSRQHFDYILVYQNLDERDDILELLHCLDGENKALFGLDLYEGSLYRKVMTLNQKQFELYIKKLTPLINKRKNLLPSAT